MAAFEQSEGPLRIDFCRPRQTETGHNRTFVERCSWTVGRPPIRLAAVVETALQEILRFSGETSASGPTNPAHRSNQ
jgi:hypothetical protein